jgi:hypothetical protein
LDLSLIHGSVPVQRDATRGHWNDTLQGSVGIGSFEFECGVLQRWNIDPEPEYLARRLAEVHAELLRKDLKSRDEAARAHNQALDLTQFEEGSRVLVYDEAGALAQGRKLRQPWLGRYRVERRLSDDSYILPAENDARVARVHVDQMREWTSGAEENGRKPNAGMWRDARRTLRGILERQKKEGTREYKVRRAGRRGNVWVQEADLPEVVRKAYELLKQQ